MFFFCRCWSVCVSICAYTWGTYFCTSAVFFSTRCNASPAVLTVMVGPALWGTLHISSSWRPCRCRRSKTYDKGEGEVSGAKCACTFHGAQNNRLPISFEGDANRIACCIEKTMTRICVIHGMHWWFSYCIIMCMCVFICICIFAQFFSTEFNASPAVSVLQCHGRSCVVCVGLRCCTMRASSLLKMKGKVTDTRWAGAATICMYWGFRIELLRYAHHRYRKQNTFAMFVCVRVWIHCIRCCINICNHSVFLHNDMWMWIVQCVFLYLRTCAHVLYVSTYV